MHHRRLFATLLVLVLIGTFLIVGAPAEAQGGDDTIIAEVDASVRAYRAANGQYNVGAGEMFITIMKQDMLWAWVIVGIPVQDGRHGAPDSHLVIVRRSSPNGAWEAAVEGTIAYSDLVNAAPNTIVSSNEKSIILSSQMNSDAPPPPGDGSSQLSLPWATGETWAFTGGPHIDGFQSGATSAWSALDFAGGTGNIRAMRDGTAYRPCANYVRIDHASGWRTGYYHVSNIAVSNGQGVSRGTFLGNISAQTGCGGSASGAHVHMALWKDGNHVNINGHDIGGYTVQNGSAQYQGCLRKVSTGQQFCVGSSIYNDGAIGSGYSVAPTDVNLIANGTFANGTENWQFGGDLVYQVINQQLRIGHTSGTSYALLGQTAPYSVPSGSQVELSLDVGNSHNQPILLYVNFMDLVELRGANCIFSLPPNTPLKRYTLRGRLTRVFDAIRIEVGFVNGPNAIRDSQLHVALDNVSLKRNSVITTEVKQCLPPKWGNDTIGIFRPSDGVFYLRNQNTTGPADIMVALGLSSDLPVSGDWNADGIDTIGVYRQSTGTFYLKNANAFDAPIAYSFVLGNPGDVPFVGDWNGNGRDGVGVFRPSNGIIYMKDTLTTGFADYAMVYGIANDKPVAGDWDGDGKDSVGIYRGDTFFLTNQTCNNCIPTANHIFVLGNAGDVPFAGDWNANGTDGVGVFRPTNGVTYFKNALTTGFADISMVYGIAGDRPIAGVWQIPAGDQLPSQVEALPPTTEELPEMAPTFVPRN